MLVELDWTGLNWIRLDCIGLNDRSQFIYSPCLPAAYKYNGENRRHTHKSNWTIHDNTWLSDVHSNAVKTVVGMNAGWRRRKGLGWVFYLIQQISLSPVHTPIIPASTELFTPSLCLKSSTLLPLYPSPTHLSMLSPLPRYNFPWWLQPLPTSLSSEFL